MYVYNVHTQAAGFGTAQLSRVLRISSPPDAPASARSPAPPFALWYVCMCVGGISERLRHGPRNSICLQRHSLCCRLPRPPPPPSPFLSLCLSRCLPPCLLPAPPPSLSPPLSLSLALPRSPNILLSRYLSAALARFSFFISLSSRYSLPPPRYSLFSFFLFFPYSLFSYSLFSPNAILFFLIFSRSLESALARTHFLPPFSLHMVRLSVCVGLASLVNSQFN